MDRLLLDVRYAVRRLVKSHRLHAPDRHGVRIALVASRGDILRLVTHDGAIQVALGVAVGLLLTAMPAQLVSGYLYRIDRLDPIAFGVQSLLLLAAALTAMLAPAWRAVRVQPTQALRQE